MIKEIGKDLLLKIFNMKLTGCSSLSDVRATAIKIESMWNRLKLAVMEVTKLRTFCIAEFIAGESANSRQLLGLKTVSFNHIKRRKVAVTYWIVTSEHGDVHMNYPNASVPLQTESYYEEVDKDEMVVAISRVMRGYGVLERSCIEVQRILAS